MISEGAPPTEPDPGLESPAGWYRWVRRAWVIGWVGLGSVESVQTPSCAPIGILVSLPFFSCYCPMPNHSSSLWPIPARYCLLGVLEVLMVPIVLWHSCCCCCCCSCCFSFIYWLAGFICSMYYYPPPPPQGLSVYFDHLLNACLSVYVHIVLQFCEAKLWLRTRGRSYSLRWASCLFVACENEKLRDGAFY